MWDIKACLACLSTDSKLERITDIFQRLYLALTGVKSSDVDGYPMYFCVECHSQIRKALLFKRRCRRSYYVLKEIVNVKKQVTFTDLAKVNRKRVNLESVISCSKPGNVDLFSIDRAELDVETLTANLDKDGSEVPKCELVKEEVLFTGNIWHVDIQPSGLTIVNEIEVKIEPEFEDDESVIPKTEENNHGHIILEDVSENIFNGNNINEESEEDFPEPQPKVNRSKKEVVTKIGNEFLEQIKKVPQIIQVSVALSRAKIRRLSKYEQMDVFTKAITEPKFINAPFKCAMCITVYKSMKHLMKHVMEHNIYITSKYICDICKTKFKDEHDLLTHKAMYHLYEYTCTLCETTTFNTMEKYIQHCKFYHNESSKQVKKNEVRFPGCIRDCFDIYAIERKTMYDKLSHPDCQYQCKECNMRFLLQDYLDTHMKKHSPLEKPFKCDICGIFTSTSYLMTVHMNAWHLYVYKCKCCDELLFNKQEAKHHKSQKHRAEMNNSCHICDKSFKSLNALRLHRAHFHYSQLLCHHCIECGDSASSLVNLYKHQLITHKYIIIDDPNTDEDRYPCESCNVKFLTLKSYQRHALKHRHEVANSFENACATCRMLFDTTEEYQQHVTTSCKILNRYPRKCAYCDLIMLNFKKYLLHHKRTHKGMPIWRLRDTKLCDLCGEPSFDIEEHMKKHGFDLECGHCSPPVRLHDVWKYCVHMLTVHTPRPFTCALCLEAYATRKECKDHILKIHAPVNPYSCATCGQEFSHVDYLNVHCKKFLHSSAEQRKRVQTTKKLYIYPHMKLNVSMFDPKVLDSIRLFMCDYAKTKRELVLDVKDHLVFDKQDELPRVASTKPKMKRYRKKENVVIDREIDLNLSREVMEEDVNEELSVTRVGEVIKEGKVDSNAVECVEQIDLGPYEKELETIEYDGVQYEDYRDIVFDEEDLIPPPPKKKKKRREKIEDRVEHVKDLQLGLDEQEFDVIERDGNQYVSINGILYQVVHEDKSV